MAVGHCTQCDQTQRWQPPSSINVKWLLGVLLFFTDAGPYDENELVDVITPFSSDRMAILKRMNSWSDPLLLSRE
jgi:hypothetical protein